MSEQTLSEYKKMLEGQLLEAKKKLATAKSSVEKIELKLSDIERSFQKEMKRGGKKVSKLAGVEVPPRGRAAGGDPAPKKEEKPEPKKKGFFDDIV